MIVYRAGYAAEHTFYHVHYRGENEAQATLTFDGALEYKDWINKSGLAPIDYWVENEIVVEDEELAVYNVRSIIGSIAEEMQVDPETEVRVYLSGPDNYRNGIATVKPYKGNRDPTRKPVHAAALKQYIRSKYDCRVSDGQEADDDMGIAHYSMWCQDPESTCISTIDKDLDTIPGKHYNFVTKEAYVVSEEDAQKFFWQQLISGDPVDNIVGIPKWGKVKAAKYVDEHWPNIVPAVRALYVQSYGDKADEVMLEMGRLLYIRKRPDEWWSVPEIKEVQVSE